MALGAAVFVLAGSSCASLANRNVVIEVELIGRPGQRSYELYLFHVVVLAAMRNFIGGRNDIAARQKPLWFLLFLTLATVVAAMIATLTPSL